MITIFSSSFLEIQMMLKRMQMSAVFWVCGFFLAQGVPSRPYVCHFNGGPADKYLHCDSSPYQILFIPGSYNQTYAKQKQNLIVIDIDQTILDVQSGFHGAIPKRHTRHQNGYGFKPQKDRDLVLMFLQEPREYSLVFRKHFFEFLHYVHTSSEFSADLVIYTRARYQYAAHVAIAINNYYNEQYRNRTAGWNNMPGMCAIY